MQVQIVVVSIGLYNYIRRKCHKDHTFAKFDRHFFFPDDILIDVLTCSESYVYHRLSQMDHIHDEIAFSLMR